VETDAIKIVKRSTTGNDHIDTVAEKLTQNLESIVNPKNKKTLSSPGRFGFAAYAKKHPSKNPKCDLHS